MRVSVQYSIGHRVTRVFVCSELVMAPSHDGKSMTMSFEYISVSNPYFDIT